MKRPVQYQMPQYQQLPGITPPIPIRQFRGINTFDPFSIDDSFFTEVSNIAPDWPAVVTRPGYTLLGSAIGGKVLGLGVWKDTELHAVFSDGTWRKWAGSTWQQLASGLSATAEWTFTNFEGNWSGVNLVGANGVDGLRRYDGSTIQTISGAPAGINYVTTYQNRVWGAMGNEIRACKLDDATQWSSFPGTEEDSYGKTMESNRGETVIMLSGGLSKLVIGMRNSMHELYGGIPSDFTTRLAAEDTGFVNNKSAFTQDAVLRFIHSNGLYEYVSGGVSPDWSFSDNVRKLTEAIGSGSVAASDGRRFYFKVDSGLLVYDLDTQTWTVWHGLEVVCFATMQGQLYAGDAQGRVLRLGGETDAGQLISWRVVTKPFTNSSTGQRSRWLKLWAMIELAAGSSLTISLSQTKDGDDWVPVHSMTGTGLQIERVLIPVRQFTLSHMLRIKIEGTGWARIHEITRQGRVLTQS